MTPERWEQVEQLYHAARTRAAGEERASYLDAACAGDAGLRREVDLLLAQQSSETGGLLDDPTRTGSPSLPDEPSVSRLAAGSQLGPYQIHSLLGSGGMGQVYKAFDARLGRDVAIKVAAERFSERFDREVRAVASLNHPNICTVYDVGPNYLVMELVDGKTLREWFRGALPLERSLGIARQVLEALALGASGGCCPSRPEARKRDGARRWLRQSAGFWLGEMAADDRAASGRAHNDARHSAGSDSRDGRVHVTGADPGAGR